MKSRNRFLTLLKLFWNYLCFILEFTITIFILFFWISQLCCAALNYKIGIDIHGRSQIYFLAISKRASIGLSLQIGRMVLKWELDKLYGDNLSSTL